MPRIDALQKYRNQLLSAFDAEQLQYLKYDNWSGLLTETDRLYATMFHDWDVLQKDCSDLAEAVQTLEWTVAPYVADGAEADRKAQEVAKVVTDALWKRTPRKPGTYSHTFTQLLGALVHGLFRGYNVHEIEWVNDGDMVYPAAFHQLPPQFMQWETRAGQVDRLLFVADGETDEPKPFPEHKFIVALNTSGPDHPLFNASYYSLIAWYGAYKFGLGWFMEYCQKYGMPKLVFHYESDRDRQQLEADLAEERVLNNILLKGDRAVDIANAPASGASLPQRELLNIAESQCHKLILGQTLTSDTSEHGGSLAQAKVHAGVQADIVKKRADFVADVLNSQLIPAIVLLNYGTLDVPMPELRYKIPQEGVTLERVQVVKTALEIQGMKLKKSEVYEFTGFAQPAEGDDVFESANVGGDMGGLAGMLGKDKPEPDNDPDKPRKKAPAQESEDVEPVSAANAEDDLRRLSEPIPQPDGTNCYTENCQRHGTGSEAEESVEQAKRIWQKRVDGQESNPIIEIKGVPVNVAVSASILDGSAHSALRKAFYQAYIAVHGEGYEEARAAWEKEALAILETKLNQQKFADVKAHILSGRNKMPVIKEAIKTGAIPKPPDRNAFKPVPQLSDSDMQEMLKRRYVYFNKRRAEILDLVEKELGVEKIDESKKSDSTYFYTRNGKKIRLSDHFDHVYNSALEKNIDFSDSDEDIRKKLRALKSDNVRSARSDAPADPAQEWIAPIKQKFLEARKAGASMADLKQMLLTMHPNTKALAKAFANNILAGFAGGSEEVTAAGSNDDSRRRKEPIEMPDGTKCYTEGCERHEDSGEGVTTKDENQLITGKHLKPASYFNKEEKDAWSRIVKNPAAKELLELVADDSQETAQSDKPVVYRKTTQEECDDIRKQAAEQNNPLPKKFNLEEYEHTINGSHITHSLKRHGHGKNGGQLKREDFALVPEIIDNPDKRTYRHKVYQDGRIERSVRYLKNFGNRSYTYVEHLLSPPTSKKSSRKRELAMVTAWLDVQKKG